MPRAPAQDAPRQEESASGNDLAEFLLADVDGPPPMELTLEDALYIALENNLDLEIADHTAEVARLDWRGSWGAFDPVFTLDLARRETDDIQQSAFPPFFNVGDVFTNEVDSYTAGFALPFETGGEAALAYNATEFDSDNPLRSDAFQQDLLTLSLTQPLLRGAGSRFATAFQRTAEIDYWIELQRQRETRQLLLRDVHNAYWDLVAALEQREVRELSTQLGLEQLEQNQRRLEVGVGTEVDVLQAEADVAQREEELLLAEVDVVAAMDQLHMLLFGSDESEDRVEAYRKAWEVQIRPVTPLPDAEGAPHVDWMASLALALDDRPDLQERVHLIERANVQLQRARSERAPQLDLSFSVRSEGVDTTAEVEDPMDPDQSLLVPLEIDVFDFESLETVASLNFSAPLGNRTRAYAERAARAEVIRARLDYRRTELVVASEVRAAAREVAYQAAAIEAAEKSVVLARRQLAAEEARYAEGLSTTFQVLEFQRDLAEALSSEKSAQTAYAKARVALERAEGRIGENLGSR